MPFYWKLKARERDSDETRARKRRTANRILELRRALRAHLGERAGDATHTTTNIRIATWNIREFDSPGYGLRVEEAKYFIAEIISHFDLIALQEVRESLGPLEEIMGLLGPGWDYIGTDVSPGNRGNDERLVYVYNRNKVWFRGIAGELTLTEDQRLMLPNSFDVAPEDGIELTLPAGTTLDDPGPQSVKTTSLGTKLNKGVALDLPDGTVMRLPKDAQLVFNGYQDDLTTDGVLQLGSGRNRSFSSTAGVRIPTAEMRTEDFQFARTPFFASFQSAWLKIALSTVHIYYGDSTEGSLKMQRRRSEIEALTRELADRAKSMSDSDADSYFIVLGDFNIVGKDHNTMEALEANGFKVPDQIKEIPAGTNVKRDKYYDQIAIWDGQTARSSRFRSYSRVEVCGAGVFDFFAHVFRHGDDDPNGEDQAHYEAVMQDEVAAGRATKTYAYKTWRTYQMSDHLPMWIELKTDFADDFLELIAAPE